MQNNSAYLMLGESHQSTGRETYCPAVATTSLLLQCLHSSLITALAVRELYIPVTGHNSESSCRATLQALKSGYLWVLAGASWKLFGFTCCLKI